MLPDQEPKGDSKPEPSPPKQLNLKGIPTNRSSREASLAALKYERRPVLLKIIDIALAAGAEGLIRHEIAAALERDVYAIGSPIIALRNDGVLVPTNRRRLTPRGCHAVVYVHVDFYSGDES